MDSTYINKHVFIIIEDLKLYQSLQDESVSQQFLIIGIHNMICMIWDTDVGAPHQPRQVPWGKPSRRGGYLAADIGEVHDGDDGGRGQ